MDSTKTGGEVGTNAAIDPNTSGQSDGAKQYQQAWDGVNNATQAGTDQANKTDFS